jgi:hypothetical protein
MAALPRVAERHDVKAGALLPLLPRRPGVCSGRGVEPTRHAGSCLFSLAGEPLLRACPVIVTMVRHRSELASLTAQRHSLAHLTMCNAM